jgi:hypothetical protein
VPWRRNCQSYLWLHACDLSTLKLKSQTTAYVVIRKPLPRSRIVQWQHLLFSYYFNKPQSHSCFGTIYWCWTWLLCRLADNKSRIHLSTSCWLSCWGLSRRTRWLLRTIQKNCNFHSDKHSYVGLVNILIVEKYILEGKCSESEIVSNIIHSAGISHPLL